MRNRGPWYLGNNQCRFTVWAPEKKSMTLHIQSPSERYIKMQKDESGYFFADVTSVPPGSRYFYNPDGAGEYPDPGSHSQPEGVHGPSEVVDHQKYQWNDDSWHGLPLRDLILYEIHVGTFTPEGTFEAMIPLLDDIASTGINALELMPVVQFPGSRNWGYDGVYPYAVQNSYGGPGGLKRLVDECHRRSIAVFLDIVYNHLGLEGNYFSRFGNYFSDRYNTPWGKAINFDGEWSDGVRDYFSDNPVHWIENYHIDGLRIDAIHMVYDSGAVNFWELLHKNIETAEVRSGRKFYLIAESDLNSPRVVQPPETGGYNFDAQWLDDFHHALYVLLDKEGITRYEDFGRMEQMAKAYTDGFVHSGEFVKFRKRKHGASSAGLSGDRFVAFNLNHDQVGNRVGGERLCVLVDRERLKIGAAALLLAPYIPMLFMGEEYADESPFFYFISHSDKQLIESVREGRKKEFENYKWETDPPDPQDEETFIRSKIDWTRREKGDHKIILEWHKVLIAMRRTLPSLQNFDKNDIRIYLYNQQGFIMHRKSSDEKEHLLGFFNFSEGKFTFIIPDYFETWNKILSSKDKYWLYEETEEGEIDELPSQITSGQEISLPPLSVAVYINRNNINGIGKS